VIQAYPAFIISAADTFSLTAVALENARHALKCQSALPYDKFFAIRYIPVDISIRDRAIDR
jgi:hypothetical protein